MKHNFLFKLIFSVLVTAVFLSCFVVYGENNKAQVSLDYKSEVTKNSLCKITCNVSCEGAVDDFMYFWYSVSGDESEVIPNETQNVLVVDTSYIASQSFKCRVIVTFEDGSESFYSEVVTVNVVPAATDTPKPTATPTITPTSEPTITPTSEPVSTETATQSNTPDDTEIPTETPVVLPTKTPSGEDTPTNGRSIYIIIAFIIVFFLLIILFASMFKKTEKPKNRKTEKSKTRKTGKTNTSKKTGTKTSGKK